LGTVEQEYNATIPVGNVIRQTPVAGAQAFPGTAVNLVVSRGTQPSVMPDVLGKPQSEAESAITGAGLVVGGMTRVFSDAVAVGNVISQSPAAGTDLAPGMAVSIVVSLGPLPTEGEPVDVDTARQQLAEMFGQADINGDGGLSFEEAASAVPGLTQAVFDELDVNGDGQLTPDELGFDAGCGCGGCRGAKILGDSPNPSKTRGGIVPGFLGDGFAVLFGMLGLMAMAGMRKW
jgi:hypothetical protein